MEVGPDLIEKECSALHRYFVQRAPPPYVMAKYRDAHTRVGGLEPRLGWFDDLLIRAACAHPLLMKLVQAYCRVCAPAAVIRKKAILVLAIMECTPESLDVVQRSAPISVGRLALRATGTLAGFLVAASISFVVIAPLHLVALLTAHTRADPESADVRPRRVS